jgi:RNA polymerase sigma factor (sigma-70 family)
MTDAQLLQSFAAQNSEAAFRTLVERHLPLIFGTARRMTGDNALAEDIAQTVFILLARKAKNLGGHTYLAGWLYQTTKFVTARALVAEQRRRRREQEAVTMQTSPSSDPFLLQAGPQLDAALARLGETDRTALLLRYFEQQSLRDVGLALGLSEDAAKKRVTRALEKLRRALSRRGLEVSGVALAAGLSREAAEAATALPLAGKISAVVLAHGAAGTGAAAGSILLTDVLAALRWAKILNTAVTVAVLLAAALVVPPAVRYVQRAVAPAAAQAVLPAGAKMAETKKPANPFAGRAAKAAISSRTLLVTVLDGKTREPIQGAILKPYANGQTVPAWQNPFKTAVNGTARLPVPINLPGGERANYCEVPVDAPGYPERVIRWSCSTGMVLNVVSSEHTVELSRGVSLSGVVVDEAGQPLAGLRVGATGFGLIGGGTEVVEQVDYDTFYLTVEKSPVVTDATGRFTLKNYPSDVRGLGLDFLGPDGDLHKFQTPEGFFIHAEILPKVSLSELKSGAARIVIPRGTTVQGIVVDNDGSPVEGAEVVEATEVGNLNILSRNRTDASGHFCLSNRPPHQVMLGVSAEGSASLSAIVSIRPGMEPISLQLPPALPLRGRVLNEAGFQVRDAKVSFEDFANRGLCLEWADETDVDGRFEWTAAPTNEVALVIMAPGFAYHLARLRASTNEAIITLHSGNLDSVHITGHVTDADSGVPVDHFQMKVSHEMMAGDIPEGAAQKFDGGNGEIDIQLLHKDFPVGMQEAWIMTLEANGYDTAISRAYELAEGDQQLEIKLERGGTVEGVVRVPAGGTAAGAHLAFPTSGPILSSTPGQLQFLDSSTHADADGRFKLKKPALASNLVVFADAGWAVVPVTAWPQKSDITLSSWARIEGTVTIGHQPAANRQIEVEDLKQDFFDPLTVFYRTTTDAEGRFSFDKMPAGNFRITCREGRWDVGTMQTCVSLAAGETKTVELVAEGRTVTTQLQAPSGFGAVNWAHASATLEADVPVPPEPVQNDFVSYEAMAAAQYRYDRDPSVLAALARRRTFAGSIDSDGLALFQQVPPGNYLLEVKLYDPARRPPLPNLDNEPNVVLARVHASVTVPDTNAASDNDTPAGLGNFALEAP